MPEILESRVGELFHHRDTRLPGLHPLIIKSVNATDLCRRHKPLVLRFDYGYDAAGRLYAEVETTFTRRLQTSTFGQYGLFDIEGLLDGERAELLRLAKALHMRPARLLDALLRHAPYRGSRIAN